MRGEGTVPLTPCAQGVRGTVPLTTWAAFTYGQFRTEEKE